jgi:hypothetical protein
MALSIVADTPSALDSLPGITKSSRWSCDIYSGTADALIATGIITPEQLKPQKGRAAGYTAFLPTGEPCPPSMKVWRDPGFKAIRQRNDGTFSVEFTVSKDVQAWRRKAEKAANHEAEEDRINKEIAENGHKYRNWTLRHEFGDWCECWEGTKAQLQAVGIGVGMKFPGEPGAPKELNCKCPLGFDVRIYLSDGDRARAAAGIFKAISRYVPLEKDSNEQPSQFAPGVLLEPRCRWNTTSDTFVGTAAALVSAGLVPSPSFFPGQPGLPKMQVSFGTDWQRNPVGHRETWGATIRKRGAKKFSVELPVSKAESERRKTISDAAEKDEKEKERTLGAERKKLRQGNQPEKTAEEFRADRAEMAEFSLKLLWQTVFAKADGALSFDLSEGTELRDDLTEAFQTIRDAVQEADILQDKKLMAAARTRLKLVAARNDKGLQSVLKNAQYLRLVGSAPADDQG